MSDLGKGQARIHWRFWMEVGPDTPVAEIPEWGDKITFMDIDAWTPEGAKQAGRLLATQVLDTWLIASGVNEQGSPPMNLPKYLRSKIEIKDMRDSPEWVALNKEQK